MQKPITPLAHGVIDYTTSAAVAAAPLALGFPAPARRLFGSLAGTYTAIAAFTNYPLAVRRTIPYKAHGASELAIAAALPTMPWVLGFADHKPARYVCLGLTALTLVVSALTDWSAER
jgi:hypothetical protein